MRLLWLADLLHDAGLNVIEEPGWENRGRDWDPVGGMQHHTAAPVPYPVTALYPTRPWEWRIKCNVNTKPDGTLHVVAAGRCNYSSGPGSSVVLRQTRMDIAPHNLAIIRDLKDDTNMNPWYINNEADHYGQGQPLPEPQWEAIVVSWQVIFKEMGWHHNRLIAHAESTARKIDPFWDGRNAHNNLNRLRKAIAGDPPVLEDHTMLPLVLYDGYDQPPAGSAGRTWKRDDVKALQHALALEDVDGKYGPATAARVDDLCSNGGETVDGDCWATIQTQWMRRVTGSDRHLAYGDDVRLRRVPDQ